jgi:hypothetical protein
MLRSKRGNWAATASKAHKQDHPHREAKAFSVELISRSAVIVFIFTASGLGVLLFFQVALFLQATT